MGNKTIVAVVAAATLSGCAQRGSLVSRGTSISEAEFETLLSVEPGSLAADYHGVDTQLRLYGVQQAARTATFADTRDWSTRTVVVGDLVSRNLRLQSVGGDQAILYGGLGNITLQRGQPVPTRLILHRFDDASSYLGKGHFSVDAAAIGEIEAIHRAGALGQSENVYQTDVTALSAVDPEGALARLGFAQGDLLADLDGAAVPGQTLDQVVGTLARAGTHTVTLIREGTTRNWVFQVQ